MKQQVLSQKISISIFFALLFILNIHGMAYAELKFIEGGTTTREIAENKAIGTNVGSPLRFASGNCRRYTLGGPDAASFGLRRVYRGVQLKTKITLDYETKNSYEVRVVASSANGSDTITVTILVTDVNEAPMFAEIMDIPEVNHILRSVPENTVAGIDIGSPVSALDPDGSEITLVYSLGGINADMFEIDSDMGQLRTKEPLDYEAFDSEPRAYFVNVQVSDGVMATETEVRVDVEPVNEFDPIFTEGDAATREIHEKEAVGANIGEPVVATDMDSGETLEYSLIDADIEIFEVDSSTGQLRSKAPLNYHIKPVHTMKVLASDGSRVGSIIVTIRVLADIVDIPDPNLARVIRRHLGLGRGADITKKAMLELTTLNANRRALEINSIAGLEHATNLTKLFLDYNSINDITPLASLTNLTTLHIEGNRVDRLGALAGLTKLTTLHLSDNWIGFVTALKDLTNLKELFLDFNRLDDLTPLAGLTNLANLHLAENYIEDLTPLESLTNLTELHLHYNRDLVDIGALAELVNLETLTLRGCPIEDFTPISGLTATIDINSSDGSAPAVHKNRTDSVSDPTVLKTLDRASLQARLQKLYAANDGSLMYRRTIAMLEGILASMRPSKTVLLTNYPNPFNPETWIPYHLAKPANVQITIYNTHGTVVRHLELGYQSVGYYISRSRAAYWDGKNNFGEPVASGIYFYQLQADTVSPLRKMVILK